MTILLRPQRGGFLRPFGCGTFIHEFLLGHGPYGSPKIDPFHGAPQSDIFFHYKQALRQTTAEDRATRYEEKRAKKEGHPIDPEKIAALTEKYLERLHYKSMGCRYHSFITYFSNLQKLGWVEPSGVIEPSAFQDNYPQGEPRIFYRLTAAGRHASDKLWANPRKTLYGRISELDTL
jgi:hypothetical protein